MVILGIDPGIKGGLAIVSTNSGLPEMLAWMRTPSLKQGKHNIVDAAKVYRWLEVWIIDQVVIEKVTSYGMGLATAYAFGKSCGSVEAIAQLKTPRIEWVTPNVWKKHFQLSKNKRASLDLAQTKFGKVDLNKKMVLHTCLWDLAANDGIAEAALLCQWFLDKKINM